MTERRITGFDKICRYWPLVVALASVVAAAAVLGDDVAELKDGYVSNEARISNIEQTLPAIQTDVRWIRETMEREYR
jgi:hypothetical protein